MSDQSVKWKFLGMSGAVAGGMGVFAFIIGAMLTIYAGIIAGAAWLLQWAWNTVAPLWDGPEVGYLHVLAAMVILNLVIGVLRSLCSGSKS